MPAVIYRHIDPLAAWVFNSRMDPTGASSSLDQQIRWLRVTRPHWRILHEAGQAAARFLTAPRLGWDPELALHHIDFYPPEKHVYAEKGAIVIDEGHTHGPLFSREIDALARAVEEQAGIHRGSSEWECIISDALIGRDALSNYTPLVAAACSHGIDLNIWIGARCAMGVAGAVTEAKVIGQAVLEVFSSSAYHNDRAGIVEILRMAGEPPTSLERHVVAAISYIESAFADQIVWNGTLAMTRVFPAVGIADGTMCWRAYCQGK